MRNHRRITTNLKTKQPELPENLAVWKSNNQGFKEETFIQMGRRGREDVVWHDEVGATVASGIGGLTFVYSGQKLGGTPGDEQYQPKARLHSPEFQH